MRQSTIEIVSAVVCVVVTSTFHGHVAEVEVGVAEGLDHDSAVNCDNVFTLPKSILTTRRGHLGPEKLIQMNRALGISLDLI